MIACCPACGAQYNVPDEKKGIKFYCKKCRAVVDTGMQIQITPPPVPQEKREEAVSRRRARLHDLRKITRVIPREEEPVPEPEIAEDDIPQLPDHPLLAELDEEPQEDLFEMDVASHSAFAAAINAHNAHTVATFEEEPMVSAMEPAVAPEPEPEIMEDEAEPDVVVAEVPVVEEQKNEIEISLDDLSGEDELDVNLEYLEDIDALDLEVSVENITIGGGLDMDDISEEDEEPLVVSAELVEEKPLAVAEELIGQEVPLVSVEEDEDELVALEELEEELSEDELAVSLEDAAAEENELALSLDDVSVESVAEEESFAVAEELIGQEVPLVSVEEDEDELVALEELEEELSEDELAVSLEDAAAEENELALSLDDASVESVAEEESFAVEAELIEEEELAEDELAVSLEEVSVEEEEPLVPAEELWEEPLLAEEELAISLDDVSISEEEPLIVAEELAGEEPLAMAEEMIEEEISLAPVEEEEPLVAGEEETGQDELVALDELEETPEGEELDAGGGETLGDVLSVGLDEVSVDEEEPLVAGEEETGQDELVALDELEETPEGEELDAGGGETLGAELSVGLEDVAVEEEELSVSLDDVAVGEEEAELAVSLDDLEESSALAEEALDVSLSDLEDEFSVSADDVEKEEDTGVMDAIDGSRNMKAYCGDCHARFMLPKSYACRDNLKCALCHGPVTVVGAEGAFPKKLKAEYIEGSGRFFIPRDVTPEELYETNLHEVVLLGDEHRFRKPEDASVDVPEESISVVADGQDWDGDERPLSVSLDSAVEDDSDTSDYFDESGGLDGYAGSPSGFITSDDDFGGESADILEGELQVSSDDLETGIGDDEDMEVSQDDLTEEDKEKF
jgi:hypothetical protein